MDRKKAFTGLKSESSMGFSRAMRIGDFIEVSGTTATNKNGVTVGKNDPYAQTIEIIKVIEKALHDVGGKLEDVIRTRVFITDLSKWEEVAKAHGEYFKEIQPTSSLIGIKGLMNPEQLVEIEVTALV